MPSLCPCYPVFKAYIMEHHNYYLIFQLSPRLLMRNFSRFVSNLMNLLKFECYNWQTDLPNRFWRNSTSSLVSRRHFTGTTNYQRVLDPIHDLISDYFACKFVESSYLAYCKPINCLRNMCPSFIASAPMDGNKGLLGDTNIEKQVNFTAQFTSQISRW